MSKAMPMDSSWISAIQLAHLDDDQLCLLAQQLEIQTQQINRAMRVISEVMTNRNRATR
jgi:hypothetical protein